MTIRNFLEIEKSYNIDDIKDFIEGLGNYENTREAMNKATGFKHANINLYTIEGYTNKNLLNSEIIEEDF